LKAFRNWVTKSGRKFRFFNKDNDVAIVKLVFPVDVVRALAVSAPPAKRFSVTAKSLRDFAD
jgi:hypothetical protein